MSDPKIRLSPEWQEYERRVQSLEDEGLTRSDAQGVVDAEDLKKDLEDDGKRSEAEPST
jgi:hypothetical protein